MLQQLFNTLVLMVLFDSLACAAVFGQSVGEIGIIREALFKIGLGDPETPSQRADKAVLSAIDKRSVAP